MFQWAFGDVAIEELELGFSCGAAELRSGEFVRHRFGPRSDYWLPTARDVKATFGTAGEHDGEGGRAARRRSRTPAHKPDPDKRRRRRWARR